VKAANAPAYIMVQRVFVCMSGKLTSQMSLLVLEDMDNQALDNKTRNGSKGMTRSM